MVTEMVLGCLSIILKKLRQDKNKLAVLETKIMTIWNNMSKKCSWSSISLKLELKKSQHNLDQLDMYPILWRKLNGFKNVELDLVSN